ncbi:PRC-barrel domain-containing protein [Spongisporangium articulatum]|uniref:PRC-barrel domain-containing protein n=1 Tax=Spongisporangium articulatum TaxID=3362603 RepID=A0ABW8AIJ9_9ACTN
MHASDLLGRPVLDADGRDLGPLRDLRVDPHLQDGRLPVRWLVVGGHDLAHRFGFVDGRTRGPAVLLRLLRGGRRDTALAVAATDVASWGPDVVRLRGAAADVTRNVADVSGEW